MAIYPVCRTVITVTALASTAILSVGCNQLNQLLGTPPGTSSGVGTESAAAVEAAGGIAPSATNKTEPVRAASTPVKDSNPTINTNHDIYRSKPLEVPAGKPVPAITVRVEPDPEIGWNLSVETANFDFAPEKVGGESGPSEGHAYLYINDKPIRRIYSTWTHLPELPPGKNEIRVTLNANGYEVLTTQNKPIQETVTVEVYDPKANPN